MYLFTRLMIIELLEIYAAKIFNFSEYTTKIAFLNTHNFLIFTVQQRVKM